MADFVCREYSDIKRNEKDISGTVTFKISHFTDDLFHNDNTSSDVY